MTVTAGRSLSHYRLVEKIGEGGMGQVWHAIDSKLDRAVAVKLLPESFSQDAERLARFEREAKLLASLNHPGIATVHGFDREGDLYFLVMELVPGEDLAQRLRGKPLSVDEALRVALELAAALEVAHAQGIVHRDLKPANIKLTPDGHVRVLDFGLAKIFERAGEKAVDSTKSPTLTSAGTLVGTILGTASYMSPEQARGEEVDRRADVWAFGTVVWEMLTGRVLFGGRTVTDVIAAVMRQELDFDALPAGTPPALRRLLARCLRRDPRRRLPDIGAARLEIEDLLEGAIDEPGREALQRARTGQRIWAVVAAVAIVAAAAFALVPHGEPRQTRRPVRFTVEAPDGWSIVRASPAPSPDGRQVVFLAEPEERDGRSDQKRMLWVRALESNDAHALAGTEGARGGFWSPDGRFFYFFTQDELRRVVLEDGTQQTICTLPHVEVYGGAWKDEKTVLFSSGGGFQAKLYSVPGTGGRAVPVTGTPIVEGEIGRFMPQLLPDGRRFLFLVLSGGDNSGLYTAPTDRPDEATLVRDGFVRRLYAGRYLLFAQDDTLYAEPFDTDRDRLRAIAHGLSRSRWFTGLSFFGVSSRTVAYIADGEDRRVQLTWVDRDGTPLATVGEPGAYSQLVLSPDERTLALEVRDRDDIDLWLMDVSRGVMTRFSASESVECDPVWSPDGRTLAYRLYGDQTYLARKGIRAGDLEEVWLEAAATGPTEAAIGSIPEDWTPDGRRLVVVEQAASDSWTISTLDLAGNSEPIFESTFFVDEPKVSPDSQWLAYVSYESGSAEVYVEPFGKEGERVRVSVDGGGQPRWRADGRELFFVDSADRLMSVDFDPTAGAPRVSLPRILFQMAIRTSPVLDEFAVSDDGRRFLVKVPLSREKPRLHVVTDWQSLVE